MDDHYQKMIEAYAFRHTRDHILDWACGTVNSVNCSKFTPLLLGYNTLWNLRRCADADLGHAPCRDHIPTEFLE